MKVVFSNVISTIAFLLLESWKMFGDAKLSGKELLLGAFLILAFVWFN